MCIVACKIWPKTCKFESSALENRPILSCIFSEKPSPRSRFQPLYHRPKIHFYFFHRTLWHRNPAKDFPYYLVLVDSLALSFIVYYYPMPQHVCCDPFDIVWSDKRFSFHQGISFRGDVQGNGCTRRCSPFHVFAQLKVKSLWISCC